MEDMKRNKALCNNNGVKLITLQRTGVGRRALEAEFYVVPASHIKSAAASNSQRGRNPDWDYLRA